MSRPFARYHKNRKAKSAHLLLKILCPIKPLASLELVFSCLRDKLQLCKPFSSDHSDSNTKFGASLILIKARAFHPHPAPLRALPRFRELEWISVSDNLRFLGQNDKCFEELSYHYCIYQKQFGDAKLGLYWNLRLFVHHHRCKTTFLNSIAFERQSFFKADKNESCFCSQSALILHQSIYAQKALCFSLLRNPIDQFWQELYQI